MPGAMRSMSKKTLFLLLCLRRWRSHKIVVTLSLLLLPCRRGFVSASFVNRHPKVVNVNAPSASSAVGVISTSDKWNRRDVPENKTGGGNDDSYCRPRENIARQNDEREGGDVLTCRILGFSPFPGASKGFLGWMLKDVHQAILVESSARGEPRIMLDFMTKGGEFHPVWYDETTKWSVMLGGNIEGEVRVRVLGARGDCRKHGATVTEAATETTLAHQTLRCSRMLELLQVAKSYDCTMNLYRNNCRIFCANMEREVDRINCQRLPSPCPNSDIGVNDRRRNDSALPSVETNSIVKGWTNSRWLLRSMLAVVLPAFYPLAAIVALCEGILHA